MAQLTFQRARTDEKKRQRAAAIVEAARSLAVESGVTSVTLTAVANRAGVHYSAVRRYFSSHKEVLLHLAAEGWTRWSATVCAALAEPGPGSPARVAESLVHGLVGDPLFCDLLANQHLHLEHEVDVERVAEVKQISNVAVMSIAESIERTLPEIGRRARWTSSSPGSRWPQCCGKLRILPRAWNTTTAANRVSHRTGASISNPR